MHIVFLNETQRYNVSDSLTAATMDVDNNQIMHFK